MVARRRFTGLRSRAILPLADRLPAPGVPPRLPAAAHVVESTLVDVPTVVGWLRPAIILPVAALAALTPAQVEAILAHELAHIRRHDYAVNVLQTLVETLLFYHRAYGGCRIGSAEEAVRQKALCDATPPRVDVCGATRSVTAALARSKLANRIGEMAMAATGGTLIESGASYSSAARSPTNRTPS